MNEQFEDNKKCNVNLSKEIKALKKLNEDLYTKLAEVKMKSNESHNIADSVENQGRKDMIEIDGIPSQQEEINNRNWCYEKVKEICVLIGQDDIVNEIDVAHRLYNDRIIVLFKNRSARNRFYFARFNLKGKTIENIGLNKPEGKKGLIWINESLTGKRKRLLAKTKDDISKAGFHVGKDGIGIFTSLGNIKVISKGQVYSISIDADIATTIHSLKSIL